MITLLHGDNVESSRNELMRLKEQAIGIEIRILDGRSINETNFTQALEANSLFSGSTLVIIENLFGKLGKKQKLITSLSAIITRSSTATDIILWEDREVSITVIKSLGSGVKVQLFKTPISLFQFLDNLGLGSAKNSLFLFQKTLETHAPELILTMIVRRLRQVIMLKDHVMPEGLQDWQASRLTSQAKSFTMEKLLSMYQRLLDIEYAIKSGNSAFTLTQHLQQYIIDL